MTAKRKVPAPLPEVRLSTGNYTVDHWCPRESLITSMPGIHDPFDLNAPYQRGSVWTLLQCQALIKSLTMGVPVGAVIYSRLPYRAGGFTYRVVDGKQRVLTIRAWINNEFECPGWWFRKEYLHEGLRGTNVIFGQMERAYQRSFGNVPMPGMEFDGQREFLGFSGDGKDRKPIWRDRSDIEIMQAEAELYLLINDGGTPQTAGDLKKAERVVAATRREQSR